jgi:hypothetical protein
MSGLLDLADDRTRIEVRPEPDHAPRSDQVHDQKQAQKRAPDLGLGELGRLSRRSGAKWLPLKVGSLQYSTLGGSLVRLSS